MSQIKKMLELFLADQLFFCLCRHYLPALKFFPTQYIYEPWTAPESVQKAAKCIVGKDYPMPMVDHTQISRINMERMRQVYKTLLISPSGQYCKIAWPCGPGCGQGWLVIRGVG